jgi:hypothetical protein
MPPVDLRREPAGQIPANVTTTVTLPRSGETIEPGSGTRDFAVTAARGGLEP